MQEINQQLSVCANSVINAHILRKLEGKFTNTTTKYLRNTLTLFVFKTSDGDLTLWGYKNMFASDIKDLDLQTSGVSKVVKIVLACSNMPKNIDSPELIMIYTATGAKPISTQEIIDKTTIKSIFGD